MSAMIKQHPLVSFFALTYLITWPFHLLGFVLADRAGTPISNEDNLRYLVDLTPSAMFPLLVYYLGQFGPVLSAFLLTAVIYGQVGVRDLSGRLLRWRVPARWYLTMLLVPLFIIAISLGAAFLADSFQLGPFSPKLPWAYFVPFLVYMVVFTGLAEEPGWRGFALPHLQAQHSAYRSSWILGVLWGIWHVPFILYFNLWQPLMLIPSLVALTLGIVGWTIVNTWVYNNTESVLLIILLHGWAGALHSYLVLSQPNFLAHTLYTLVPWAIAIFLAKRYGEEDLGPLPRPRWWPGRYDTERRGDAASPPLAVQPRS